MRSVFAYLLLLCGLGLCGLALSCQTEPSQTERELLTELQSLKAERESRDYLGELQKAVEGWRKAMNASLAKNKQELVSTRLESQKQITAMADRVDDLVETLVESLAKTQAKQEADHSRSQAELQKALAELKEARAGLEIAGEELQKERVQVGKTLEAMRVEREVSSAERGDANRERKALDLERKKNLAMLESATKKARDALAKQRQQDLGVRKELADKLERLTMTSARQAALLENLIAEQAGKINEANAKQTGQLDKLLLLLDGYRKDVEGVNRGLASIGQQLVELDQVFAKSQDADVPARREAMEHEFTSISRKLAELQAATSKSRDPEASARMDAKIEHQLKAIEALRKAIALEREQGRQDRQGLQARLDALAEVVEKSFGRLEKQNQKARQARAAEAAVRRAPRIAPRNKIPGGKQRKKAEVGRKPKSALKSALPSREARLGAMSEAAPFWQNPFIAIPGAFLLLVLLFFLLRRSPDEVGMDLREASERSESEALEAEVGSGLTHRAGDEKEGARQVETPAGVSAEEGIEGVQGERRMPLPRKVLGENLGQGASQGQSASHTAMPRPRCLSLRIPGDELTEGAEELLHERLARDPRILVEPRPRLERRGDGSLSARFYSVGGLPETEVEALSRSLRSLVANR